MQGVDPGSHPHLRFDDLSLGLRGELRRTANRLQARASQYLDLLDLMGVDCPHIWVRRLALIEGGFQTRELLECRVCTTRRSG